MLLMVQSALDATPAGTWTPPPGMTNRAEASVGLASLNIGDKLLGAPGATGTQTATHSPAGSLQGLLLALRSTQTTYAYDPQGNRTTRTAPGAVVTTYGYDQANRLKTVTGGPPTPTTETACGHQRRSRG
jgi:YD repeat-containing protein